MDRVQTSPDLIVDGQLLVKDNTRHHYSLCRDQFVCWNDQGSVHIYDSDVFDPEYLWRGPMEWGPIDPSSSFVYRNDHCLLTNKQLHLENRVRVNLPFPEMTHGIIEIVSDDYKVYLLWNDHQWAQASLVEDESRDRLSDPSIWLRGEVDGLLLDASINYTIADMGRAYWRSYQSRRQSHGQPIQVFSKNQRLYVSSYLNFPPTLTTSSVKVPEKIDLRLLGYNEPFHTFFHNLALILSPLTRVRLIINMEEPHLEFKIDQDQCQWLDSLYPFLSEMRQAEIKSLLKLSLDIPPELLELILSYIL